MTKRAAIRVLPIAGMVVTAAVLATTASAQGATGLAELGTELVDAQRGHLWRVATWGGASLLAGVGLLAATDGGAHPGRRGFGM